MYSCEIWLWATIRNVKKKTREEVSTDDDDDDNIVLRRLMESFIEDSSPSFQEINASPEKPKHFRYQISVLREWKIHFHHRERELFMALLSGWVREVIGYH